MYTPKVIIHRLRVPEFHRSDRRHLRKLWVLAATVAGLLGSLSLTSALRETARELHAVERTR
jgi:hypothetical protein